MGFFKKQLLEVIEWKDSSKDTIVYRFPMQKREEIMTTSTLVVRESQVAVFVHKGQICDIFEPGTYKLKTENIPFLTKLLSLPTGFNSPIKAEVYFINTKQMTGQKWGTQNPIMMRDNEFGNVRLRGFGVYSFKVEDAAKFMKEMFGTNEVYRTADVAEQCKPMIIEAITDAIAESKISALDLAANYREFSETVVNYSTKSFGQFGLKLCSVVIENLSLPEDVEKALDERTKLGVLEDQMGTYTRYQAAQALKEAAKNPSGGNLAGLGVGLGAGSSIGQIFGENLSTENKKKVKMATCPNCNERIKEGSKFCPSCGQKLVAVCSKCGKEVEQGAKFCTECGEKLSTNKVCQKCNCELDAKDKFCPKCGTKCD